MSTPERLLIWVPVIHTQADMGSLSKPLQRLYLRRIGREQWERHSRAVDEMWEGIGREIQGLDLPYDKVRLYQDGLPNCGHEREIVRDLAKAGSRNHQLLLDLMKKGAKLTGTESPDLLLREYELAREILMRADSSKDGELARRQAEMSRLMLDNRDSYIADRINETLALGETGIVFLGMLHSLGGRLASDIQVIRIGQGRDRAAHHGEAQSRRPGGPSHERQ